MSTTMIIITILIIIKIIVMVMSWSYSQSFRHHVSALDTSVISPWICFLPTFEKGTEGDMKPSSSPPEVSPSQRGPMTAWNRTCARRDLAWWFTSVCGKTRCHFYVHVSFYQTIWVQCVDWQISRTLLSLNLPQDLSIDSGRTCKARVETEVGTWIAFHKGDFQYQTFSSEHERSPMEKE